MVTFLENLLLYHPVRAGQSWNPPPNDLVRDVALRAADGTRLHAWWCPTPGWEPARGAVLYCHGNAGNLSHRGQLVGRWQQPPLEQAVLLLDYPGYGKCDGKPSEAGCYAAAEAGYDWLCQTQGLPPGRVLVYGGSLGGGVAIELARHRPHRALVLVGTFTSIPDMARHLYPWLPVGRLLRNRFDNLAKIGSCRRPVFLAHGTADRLVPFAQAERLYAAANPPKRFFPLERLEHHHTPVPEFYTALHAFLKEAESAGELD